MKHNDSVHERLKVLKPFVGCSTDELRLISSHITAHSAPAGEVLAAEGRGGHEFIVIVSGTAKVLVGDTKVSSLGPGDFFGEVSLLDNGPRTASVVAETELEAEVCSQQEFREMLRGAPTVAVNLLYAMAARLREARMPLHD